VLPLTNVRFDHVAVAAPRLRDLLAIYRDVLGGVYADGYDNARQGYRTLQLGYANGQRVELMEPLGGSTFFDKFFARNPQGGMHHMTFKVDDIEAALTAMTAAGYTPTSEYRADPDWQEVFFHPREAFGVLIQLAQANGTEDRGHYTLDDVLAGRGPEGTGVPSP
jgi:methylmalonyl-CoA/ethylmalonyl-CoA epimerase